MTVTNVGLNFALDALGTFYVGLIEDTSFAGISGSDTSASHAGWTECTAYDEATRPAWGDGAASAQAITNGTAVEFTMNATKTVKGLFLISNATKGGATGTLLAASLFDEGDRAMTSGQKLKLTITINGIDATVA